MKSAPSKKTDFLIYGQKLEDGRDYKEGRKYQKAVELKTKLLSENELEDFLFGLTGKKIGNYFNSRNEESEKEQNINSRFKKTPKQQQEVIDIESEGGDEIPRSKSTNSTNKNLHSDNDLWTENFKPISSEEILGNKKLIGDLKNWLNDW